MDGKKRSILLVEDQAIIATVEKRSLESYGYTVTTLDTGEKALKFIQDQGSADLILMDIDLGKGMNGPETAVEILKIQDIPILFLSAHTEPDIVELTERITSYGYVVKSSSITVLDASIKMAFKLFEAKQKEKIRENALQDSERSFRLLFQNLNTNFALHEIVLDEAGKAVDYRYLLINPSFEKTVGIPAEIMVGKTARELFPGTEDYWIEKFGEVAISGVPLHYENYSKELDRYFEMNVYSPQKGQFALIGLDISERRRAEELVKRHNNLFEALLKNLPVGVFMVEAPSGKPLLANDAALTLLGRGILPDATKQNLAEVYKAYKMGTGEAYPPTEMPILISMGGEASHVDDMLVERPDGSRTRLEIFGSPIKDENGNVWASLVSFLDITERKQSEEKLRESEVILQCHIENSFDVIFTLNHLGEFQFISPAWEQHFGFSGNEALFKPFMNFVHPDDVAPLMEYMGTVLSTGKKAKSPAYRVKHADGSWRWLVANGTALRSSGGEVRFIGVAHELAEASNESIS